MQIEALLHLQVKYVIVQVSPIINAKGKFCDSIKNPSNSDEQLTF